MGTRLIDWTPDRVEELRRRWAAGESMGEIASAGVTTIRFTGLEILSNPIGCAHEALTISLKRSRP